MCDKIENVYMHHAYATYIVLAKCCIFLCISITYKWLVGCSTYTTQKFS